MLVTLLVLADPAARQLALLDRLPDQTRIVAGNTPQVFEGAAVQAEVILAWFAPRALLEPVWQMAPRVRWVHTATAGLDALLFPALISSPVPLTNSRGVFSGSLAEFVLGAVLFFAKDFRRLLRSQAVGVWDPFDPVEIAGQTLGLVGYGDIGQAVAGRARAFSMEVLAVDRRADPDAGVYPPEALHQVLAASDYVVTALPLTPATQGLIGEAELRAMKPEAVFMNVGRGPVVDEAALVRALQAGWIRGAALDVFQQEPLPAGHPFYGMENVLLSPHCADHVSGWMDRAMELFLENFERFRKGEPLLNIVDKKAGY